MTDKYPPFSLHGDQFDQTIYSGRLLRCFNVVDPRTLLVTDAKLNESVQLLEAFKNGSIPPGISNQELWNARKIKEAILHPDTGEKIYRPFRMSGFVPFGTVTVVGMLIPGASTAQVIFWQWLNQSHNAAVNYSNRNATKPTPTSRFLMSYGGAVSSAIAIATGLSTAIKKSPLSASAKLLASRFVAYPATATASFLNVFLMRQNELYEGLDVSDSNGNVLGSSKVAAKKAVTETAISRILLPAPILILPPLMMNALEKTALLKKNPRLGMPANVLCCVLSFGLALPCTIALFPQFSKMPTNELAPEIASRTSGEFVYFNKGL